ncbi:DUF1697 domain-containing protein [Isoptericola jiangsuensis]|uniref:DUF1697 domain-containing protein n=1 Tax=Isoptericola jiangsuensis TaxID=548579 RepID=UPI003AACD804
MTTYVVLLRGVNVGGNRRVPASDLRSAAADAGLHDARTYANSGNLVAAGSAVDDGAGPDAPTADVTDVADALASALAGRVGLEVPLLVVTAARLERLVAAVPFPETAHEDPARLQLHLGPRDVDDDGLARLAARHDGPERLATAEGALYVHYVDGLGRTRLNGPRIDEAAGTWTTGRNWRTVTRLVAMANERP